MDKILLREINIALQLTEYYGNRADAFYRLKVNMHPLTAEPSTHKERNMLSQKIILSCYYFI